MKPIYFSGTMAEAARGLKTATTIRPDYLDRPRLQFNWGYWDAIALTSRGIRRPDGLTSENILQRHPDPFYANGWLYGEKIVRGEGEPGRSSDPAWTDFVAGLTDPALLFRIEANP